MILTGKQTINEWLDRAVFTKKMIRARARSHRARERPQGRSGPTGNDRKTG